MEESQSSEVSPKEKLPKWKRVTVFAAGVMENIHKTVIILIF